MITGRIAVTGLWLLGFAGCRQTPLPPAEAVVATALPPAGVSVPLDALLARMEAELDTALLAGPDGGLGQLYRAEELSNRLLEAQVPFAWLEPDQYSVEARLRQIQSQADRIVARIRGGGRSETIMQETTALRDGIRALRAGLAQGGGAAPVPVERLLVTLDTTRR